jgi:hypothetical protein
VKNFTHLFDIQMNIEIFNDKINGNLFLAIERKAASNCTV